MQQYRAAKERHAGMLLLFRMGDFYELFEEDAEAAHRLLGLTLTTRDRTVPMAGFPHHQLEAYLHKLLHAGKRVAICEPVEESLARGPIRREVTRVVTPGSIVEDEAAGTKPVRKPKQLPKRHGNPVRQPRHFVIKQYEAWLRTNGLTFVRAEEARRTTPAVEPYAAVLDFIVLQRDEKRLVTLRPILQAKHLKAIRELRALFGAEHKPVRIWPRTGEDGWIWQEFPVDDLPGRPS